MYAFSRVLHGWYRRSGHEGVMAGVVPPNAQGELQGGFTSLMSLTSIFGPILMNNLYAFFTKPGSEVYFPGAAMLLGAVLTVVSVILSRRTLKKYCCSCSQPTEQAYRVI